jgi:tetratricopeptide (TPR) repeat protein
MENQATYELIEKYLNGELSQTEKDAFERRLKDEADFAEEVNTIKALHQLVELKGDQMARLQIEKAAEAFSSQRLVRQRRILVISLVAIMAILALIFYPEKQNISISSEELFTQNFTPFRAPANVRSDDSLDYWTEVRTYYEEKNFAGVIDIISKQDLLPEDYPAHFYLGVSYLALDSPKADSAILALDKVLQTDNDYVEIAGWYLGLAYLKQRNISKAKEHFGDLIEKGNTYHREKILDLLERMK